MDYESLESEYSDCNSLSYKKIRIVNKYLPTGGEYLDIGSGTGEMIAVRTGKHKKIVGIDLDKDALSLCHHRFAHSPEITIIQAGIMDLPKHNLGNFDSITCLDVLEHINENDIPRALSNVYRLLNTQGIFIFSGPGIFEKIRIFIGKSPTHLHSHSSYGWMKMIKNAGFEIVNVETAEFPIFHTPILKKKLHLFGMCCIIVARKP